MHDRERAAKMKPQGPFSPPLPHEVEEKRGEPMAVARDKEQTHGESFLATTAPMDQYDDEIAERYRQVPSAKMVTPQRDENRAMERPEGYTNPDERGWAHLRTGEEEKEETESAAPDEPTHTG